MRLELAYYPIKDVQFTNQIAYKDGVLEVNKEELIALILKDKKIASAEVDVARPGEKTRIVPVQDAVAPRLKVSGPGCVFPGILGPVETVGEGRTNELSNISVMVSAEYRPTIESGTGAQNSGIVDMWGSGAAVTPFGSLINLVLILKLGDDVTELEAHSAIQLAECRIAERLAKTTLDLSPEKVENFELSETDPSLPRVVYILSCMTAWHDPHSGHAFYGLPVRESLPTFIHPNELIDGSLTSDTRKGRGSEPRTWEWMNNPVLFELMREHGKRLNFLGIILQRTRFETEFGKRVTAEVTSQLARLLKADGAISTRISPSGNNFVDVMFTLQACEKKGVKTVMIAPEWGGRDGKEAALKFYVPEAVSMISTTSQDREINLQTPDKVIGAGNSHAMKLSPAEHSFSAWKDVTLDGALDIAGGIDWLGGLPYSFETY